MTFIFEDFKIRIPIYEIKITAFICISWQCPNGN